MSEEEKERKTYAEAMHEWANTRDAQRALLSKSRNTLLHPDPLSSALVRTLGYLWRFAVLLVFAAGIYFMLLMWHLRDEKFSRLLAGGAARHLGAEKADLSPLRWRKSIASARSFTAEGGPHSFFRKIEAENIDFRLPITMLLRKQWDLKHLGVGKLHAELRSGGLGGEAPPVVPPDKDALPPGLEGPPSTKINTDPDAKAEHPGGDRKILDLRIRTDGFGVNPDFTQLKIGEIEAANAQITWGLTEFTRGAIDEASLLATPDSNGGWNVALTSGKIRQNWLHGLTVKKLLLHCTNEAVECTGGVVQVGSGIASLNGRITVAQNPRVELKLDAENLPIESFLSGPAVDWLRISGTGQIVIEGSLNLASGVTTTANLRIDGGSLRQVPILNTLAVVCSRGRFRDLEITSGILRFSTGGGKLDVETFELQSKGDVIIRGGFSWQQDQFNGLAQIGMTKDYAQRLPRDLQKEFFHEGDAGMLWMQVPLDGPTAGVTKALGNRLAAAYQQASQR